MNGPNRKRKTKATKKRIVAAKALAEGKSKEDAAREAGYTSVKSVERAQREVIRLENLDDVQTLRTLSVDRLDAYRRKLCRIAGVIDHEDPDVRQPPPKPVNTPDRRATPAELAAWVQECAANGFDPNGDPFHQCENAGQQTMAIARLIAIEQRRARLLGLDAPKIVAQVSAKSIRTMNTLELSAELTTYGLELPPGLMDALRKNHKDPASPVPPPFKSPDQS